MSKTRKFLRLASRIVWHFSGVLCGALILLPAQANDSTATIDTYGIHFKKSSSVVMASERLLISREKIEVDYVFINEGKQDVVETVVFPMPREPRGWESDVMDWASTDAYYRGFSVTVDGQKVPFQRQVRAFMDGEDGESRDITARLLALGLNGKDFITEPLSPRVAKIVQTHIQKDWDRDDLPWSVQIFYHWQQRFPAGKAVRVHHSYPPVIGGRIFAGWEKSDWEWEAKEYCTPPNEYRRFKPDTYLDNANLRYILTTGANWAGPIRDFHLVIEKAAPDERIALCWPDSELKKVSPLRFETRLVNFTPKRDLAVLFYAAMKTEE